MEAIKQTFQRCKAEKRVSRPQAQPHPEPVNSTHGLADNALDLQQSALVTYVTAGYPKPEDTADICLSMERGGAGTPHQAPFIAAALGWLLTQTPAPRYH